MSQLKLKPIFVSISVLCLCLISFPAKATDEDLTSSPLTHTESSVIPSNTSEDISAPKAEISQKGSEEKIAVQPQSSVQNGVKLESSPTLAQETPSKEASTPKQMDESEEKIAAEPDIKKTEPIKNSFTAEAKSVPQPTFQWNPAQNNAGSAPNSFSHDENQLFVFQSTSINKIQPKKSLFFQTNIGVGFLYFSNVTGNLSLNPATSFQFRHPLINAPLKGRLTYNRTPLYESLLGWRVLPWFKFGLSYQHQGGVTVQTPVLVADVIRPQLTSNLSLDALMAKIYFELPHTLIFNKASISPYLALGFGSGWQSWTRVSETLTSTVQGASPRGDVVYFKQEISANAVWMFDLGFRTQRKSPYSGFSATMGIKYNQWGQARNIGKASKQAENKVSLFKPFRVRTVYQWSPYLGVQWNFSPAWTSKSPYALKGKSPNTWKPYWINVNQIQAKGSIWTQFNAGIGFLYFNNVQGLLRSRPQDTNFLNGAMSQVLSYNRTPLFEYLIGYRLTSWLKPSFSYQYQGNITVQSEVMDSLLVPGNTSQIQLTSNLNLNAIMFKCYFELPWPVIFKNMATTPYTAVGVGPSWQTWSRTRTTLSIRPTTASFFYRGLNTPVRQKICANAALNVDMGLRLRSAFPNSPYSVNLGCKYNYWGQARNIGILDQQDSFKYINQKFTVKNIHQFSPYLGFQWNFLPACVDQMPYMVGNKKANTWRPFFTPASNLQKRSWKWTQFNVGIGFLYFANLKGNIMIIPPESQSGTHRDAPLKHGLSYNRTPLFEYLMGVSASPSLKFAISYQHQGGVTIETDALDTFESTNNSAKAKFTSNLSLDGLMGKVYFHSPYAMIWKGLSASPYLALGVGAGWQSWTRTNVTLFAQQAANGTFLVEQFALKQTLIASVAWMWDVGFNFSSARPDAAFSLWTGCKYNQWGQARNIGKITKQGSVTRGLFKPIRIQTVYQFAPYLGVQWNY